MHAYVSLPVNLRLINAGQKAANHSLIPRRYQLAAVYKLLQAAERLLEGSGLDQLDPSQRPPVITVNQRHTLDLQTLQWPHVDAKTQPHCAGLSITNQRCVICCCQGAEGPCTPVPVLTD